MHGDGFHGMRNYGGESAIGMQVASADSRSAGETLLLSSDRPLRISIMTADRGQVKRMAIDIESVGVVASDQMPKEFGIRMKRLGSLLTCCLLLAGPSLPVLGTVPQQEDLEFFETRIRPVLAEQCYRCHSHAAESLKASLRLDSRAGFLEGGDNGPVAVPGEPERSRFIEAISYTDIDLQMPPRSKLDDAVIADFREWVGRGLPWPREEEPGKAGAEPDFDLEERREQHWAWQPVLPSVPPEVERRDWPSNPVDAFVLHRLEEEGIGPAPEASRSTLLRRLSYALTGLPPAEEEVLGFIDDPDPMAWERRVDALLASPRMGERWARHWLDLVRYAETLGHEFDYVLPNAWRYRDYVIRAFNADVDYPRFVTEHIAGDLMEHPRRDPAEGINESWTGTGFYWLGQQVHSPVDIGMNQLDLIDNQVDVLTKTFLGMTVSCARCHDHKFDAISTRDFYSLFGILGSSRYHEADLEPPERWDGLRDSFREGKEEVRAAASGEWRREGARMESSIRAALALLAAGEDEGVPDGEVLFDGFEPGATGEWSGGAIPGGLDGARDFIGEGLASTSPAEEGRAHRGQWTSAVFTVEHPFIHFLVAGGSDARGTAFELRVGDKAVRSATGGKDLRFSPHRWDVEEFIGREARFVLRDDADGDWGFLAVDHILLSGRDRVFGHGNRLLPSREKIVEAARGENLDDGILDRWVREIDQARSQGRNHPLHALVGEGAPDAESSEEDGEMVDLDGWFPVGAALVDARIEPGEPVLLDRGQGLILATRSSVHSARWSRRFQGSLRSPTFRIEERYYHALVSGRASRANIVLDNFNMIRAPIYGGLKRRLDFDQPRWITFDLGNWMGHLAYFEIKDTEPGDLAGRAGYGPDGWFSLHATLPSSGRAPPAPAPLDGAYLRGMADEDPPADCARRTTDLIERWIRGEMPSERDLEWLSWLSGKGLLSSSEGPLSRALSRYAARSQSILPPRLAPAMVDGSGVDAPVLVRGNPRTPGEMAPRQNLEALGTRAPFTGSGRLALARHITDPANPLTARVYVNRVWHHLFGRGIVESPDNFGVLGREPTHPELLDWLADWFVNEGQGSTKRLLRLLLTSSTWRMASASSEGDLEDPANRWFHRMNVRRLEGEAIRDAMLQVSGRIDLRQFGPPPPVHLTNFMTGRGRPGRSGPLDGEGRRSVYQEVRRNFLSPAMLAFDTPLPFTTFGRRSVSNVPAQALILLNDPLVIEMAEHWAGTLPTRFDDAGARVDHMYLSALGRLPLAAEREKALAYVGAGGEEAWADLCHVLFNVKEFIYLD